MGSLIHKMAEDGRHLWRTYSSTSHIWYYPGGEDILLVVEVIRSHSFASWKFCFPSWEAQTLPVPSFSAARGLQFSTLQGLRENRVSLFFNTPNVSLLTSSHCFFVCQQRVHVLQLKNTSPLALRPVLQASLWPQTCRAVPILESSNWIKASEHAAIIVSVNTGDCALWHVTAFAEHAYTVFNMCTLYFLADSHVSFCF